MERVVEGDAGVASVSRSEQEREWKGAMTKQASRIDTDIFFFDSSDFFSNYSKWNPSALEAASSQCLTHA